ncbi:hypothetical protein [Massilia genomosp. 1]|uniref:Uncharacterized protein n=1 Tax=Massilia genomosp. 1 TaxID=2609280 RepID=A0ABX0MTX6_9BURK|nr:hypothetical protein [Massilia genomosp. 1]NHZ66188.1 hypothetical protein [Massilia genomosp. 1]
MQNNNCRQLDVTREIPRSVPLTLRELTGRRVRVVPFGALITQEFIGGRVTIYLNQQNLVRNVVVETCD